MAICVQPADKQRLHLLTEGQKLLEDTAKLADAGVENDQELAVTFETEGENASLHLAAQLPHV